MRIPLNPCYILHKRNYLETSLLLDVFSRNHGRVGLVAKGAKRKRSIAPGVLQPYRRLLISWSGKGELYPLTGIDPATPAATLTSAQVMSGFYLNELILRLLHKHESHADLFDAYEESLLDLGNGCTEQHILRIFEKRLLQSLGYGLILDHEALTGRSIDRDRVYYYQFDQGPLSSKPDSPDHIKLSGHTLQALRDECLEDEISLREAKLLMRTILLRHLGGKPLASRELYKAYLRNRAKE